MNYIPSVILYSNPMSVYAGNAIDTQYWFIKDAPEREFTVVEFLLSKDSFYTPWLVLGTVVGVVINGVTRVGKITFVQIYARSGEKSELWHVKLHLEKETGDVNMSGSTYSY